MKYKWESKPPPKIVGVASERANVWPKPVKETLKYAKAVLPPSPKTVVVAIGQLKNGRWEVYFLHWKVTGDAANLKLKYQWLSQSRMHRQGYRIGYTNYANAYRSIPQHLKRFQSCL